MLKPALKLFFIASLLIIPGFCRAQEAQERDESASSIDSEDDNLRILAKKGNLKAQLKQGASPGLRHCGPLVPPGGKAGQCRRRIQSGDLL